MTGLVRKATLIGVCGLLAAATAFANVPSPGNSTLPVWIPMHGFTTAGAPQPVNAAAPFPQQVTLTVRDFTNNPIAGSNVEFDFSGCDVHVCEVNAGGGTFACSVAHGKVLAQTNAAGQVVATFYGASHDGGPVASVPGAGAGLGGCVAIRADGVDLGVARFFAYDLNGGPPTNQPGQTGVDNSLEQGNVALALADATKYRSRSDLDGSGTLAGPDNSIMQGTVSLSSVNFNNGCRSPGGAVAPYCP